MHHTTPNAWGRTWRCHRPSSPRPVGAALRRSGPCDFATHASSAPRNCGLCRHCHRTPTARSHSDSWTSSTVVHLWHRRIQRRPRTPVTHLRALNQAQHSARDERLNHVLAGFGPPTWWCQALASAALAPSWTELGVDPDDQDGHREQCCFSHASGVAGQRVTCALPDDWARQMIAVHCPPNTNMPEHVAQSVLIALARRRAAQPSPGAIEFIQCPQKHCKGDSLEV